MCNRSWTPGGELGGCGCWWGWCNDHLLARRACPPQSTCRTGNQNELDGMSWFFFFFFKFLPCFLLHLWWRLVLYPRPLQWRLGKLCITLADGNANWRTAWLKVIYFWISDVEDKWTFFFSETRKQPLSFPANLEPVEAGKVAGSKPQQLLNNESWLWPGNNRHLPFLRDREDVFFSSFSLSPEGKYLISISLVWFRYFGWKKKTGRGKQSGEQPTTLCFNSLSCDRTK